MAVVIETTIGDFTVDLYTDSRPQTCRNFLKLCKIKYYNWNLFFTVQSNFIAQTGDPTATTNGGESIYGIILGKEARYYEAEKMPKIKHDRVGLISMVNCGNNMLGSQFFITLGSDLQSLNEHCVFGEITEGLEVVLKFNETICDADHRPYQDIRISHTVILEDPYDDPKGLVIPDRSPEPTKEALMSDRIGADEVIDDTAGMTAEEIEEMQKEKEAKARATILEIVGDIPDAEMAPPENVLFVCKLNPVTTDDDLEIIFSRFGKIIGCEVIRDRQTGDSLQYAFIEFADRKSCEEAYFKMDNVLIDDRRIHVDFSQSVAKMRWRGKGKGIKYFDDDEKEGKNNQEKSKDDNRNRNYKRRSRSNSPRRERSRYDNRDKYQSKKDDRKKQDSYKNGDDKKRSDKEKKSQRRRERSNSNCSKNSDSGSERSRSRSIEKKKSKKEKNRSRSKSIEKKKSKRRSRSIENKRNRKEKSRSRSIEKSRSRKERSRSKSIEKSRSRKERSRSKSIEKSRSRKERSRSREKVRERKERSRERSRDRKDRKSNRDDRSDKYSTSKRRKSRERSEERSEHRRKHKHKSR